MLSTQHAQSDSCPEFHLLIICLLVEHMVHFHAIRGTTNSWKSLTKNNVHKIRSSFLCSFVSDKKPDPWPIKINDYFGSCHLKILADRTINMWREFQLRPFPVYMSLQKYSKFTTRALWQIALGGCTACSLDAHRHRLLQKKPVLSALVLGSAHKNAGDDVTAK